MSDTHTSDGFQIRGHHVLIAMIAFFAVIIAVNAVYITVAVRSFPGTTTEHSFKRGLAPDFNRTQAERDDQAVRGWIAQLEEHWDEAQRTAVLRIRMTNAQDEPLPRLTLTGELRRAVTNRDDAIVTFNPVGGGLYEAEVSNVDAGNWELILHTEFPDGAPFTARKRLWLR